MSGRQDDARSLASPLWRAAARVLLALGSLSALVRWGVGPVASVAAVTFIVGVSVGIMIDLKTVGRAVRLAALATGLLLTGSAMLAGLTWSDVVLLVPLLALGGLLLRRRPEESTETVTALEDPPAIFLPDLDAQAAALPALSDDELCQWWRRTFTALGEAGTAGQRLDVVRARQLYLDEIERRHPTELRAWLASGARAAGNPMPFLTRRQGSGLQPLDGPSDSASGDARP